MRLSHIHIQQTLLTLNHKKSTDEINKEIQCRCNSMINQISIFNSHFDRHIFPTLTEAIQFLIIRKSHVIELPSFQIFGSNLKIVQLSNCNLKQFPKIYSSQLHKLNVSHNQIQEIVQIRNKGLKLLDIRNNKISRITQEIYSANLTVLYEFISKRQQKDRVNLPRYLRPQIIDVSQIVSETIKQWSNQELIQNCEQIIQNSNNVLLSQILPYLANGFITKIYELAKLKRKHSIIQALINTQNCEKPSNQQAIELLMPQYISNNYLQKLNLSTIIKILSTYNNDKQRVQRFFTFLTNWQNGRNYFIQSQKDLINFMSLNINNPNSYEVEFLMTQVTFFNQYDFSNQAILKYLLHFDGLSLVAKLLELTAFKDKVFALNLYKKLLKPNKKTFKVLQKEDKNYQKAYKNKNQLYFPEYKQRKAFCLKNDLYDYQILSEYQQMQCSYSRKDLKYTFKFCNKQNEISIAKRIQTVLKKKCLKNMQVRRSQYSTNSSNCQF